MRINDDLLGKGVIDESGDHVGFVKEVDGILIKIR